MVPPFNDHLDRSSEEVELLSLNAPLGHTIILPINDDIVNDHGHLHVLVNDHGHLHVLVLNE